MSKKYEAVIILDDQMHEDGGTVFIETFTSAVGELGGTIDKNESMGRRQLAYPIRKKTSGVYWHSFMQLAPDTVSALRERYSLDQTILRLEVFINERPERYSLKPDLPPNASPAADGPTPTVTQIAEREAEAQAVTAPPPPAPPPPATPPPATPPPATPPPAAETEEGDLKEMTISEMEKKPDTDKA
jgi:small subunit ribosomal protein S6